MKISISLIILIIIFILIAIRRIGKVEFKIWQIMSLGAIAVLVTMQITPIDAFKSINWDVIVFLITMFIIGEAMIESHYLYRISYLLFNKANSVYQLLLFIILFMGIFSAIIMNDTTAIIGTPLVLYFAKKDKIHAPLMLLALAFSITIGSVMSPIGNPQNLLIAIGSNMRNPFVEFIKYLFIPTIINLFVAYLFLRFFYRKQIKNVSVVHENVELKDSNLAKLCKISLIMILVLISIKVILAFLNITQFDITIGDFKFTLHISLTYISVISCLPIVLFSKKRFLIVKSIDWSTILFFIAMFIVMQSVWNSGFFQDLISKSHLNLVDTIIIMVISVIFSQFISNVPLVALYIPLLTQLNSSVEGYIALAAGSTIAGNMLILGAASNVIIIQNAEKKHNETIKFWEFAKIGIPLTIANTLVYYLFIKIVSWLKI